ncbi:MAG: SdpI family protein [Armatimonadota bacterium]
MKKEWLPLTILAAMIAVAIWQYPYLPDNIPTHFGITGEADAWSSKLSGLLTMPVMALFIYILLSVFAWLGSTERGNLCLDTTSKNILLNLRSIMMFMMLMIQAGMILYAYGNTGFIMPALSVSLGLMFIYIGWSVRHVSRNWIIGMRLPWTLADDDNWRKTNTFGGKVFIVLGILTLLTAFYPILIIPVILAGTILGTTIITIYSYWIYRTKQNNGGSV